MHLLEDHPQQVQEEREILAKEKAEKQAEKMRLQKEKDDRKMARMAEAGIRPTWFQDSSNCDQSAKGSSSSHDERNRAVWRV